MRYLWLPEDRYTIQGVQIKVNVLPYKLLQEEAGLQ